MPTQPSEIFDLARLIHGAAPAEAGWRSSSSRAYYAALLSSETVFGRHRGAGNGSSHDDIIGAAIAYGRSGKPGADKASVVAHLLPKMRRVRNAADYRIGEPFAESECLESIQRSSNVIQACADASAAIATSPIPIQAAAHTAPQSAAPTPAPTIPPSGPTPTMKRVK